MKISTLYKILPSNSQWEVISKYLDTQRSREYELRHIIDAILYLVKTGCQWRMLRKPPANPPLLM